MRWYAFPENARNRIAPPFRLLSSEGRPIALADYRGRSNLVLFFAHGLDCAPCRAALVAFAAHSADYRARAAEVLVVSPTMMDETLPATHVGPPVLSDPAGEVRRAYAALLPNGTGDDQVLLFVLDRYGAPYAALACPEADAPTLQQEVLEWLAFIEVQCPE